MLAPAHTALARPAAMVRVAYENMTNPNSSASTPPTSGTGRSRPCPCASSTTPVTSDTTVTSRKTMTGGEPGPGRGYRAGPGRCVREGGVEPPRPKAPDPKSGVAAVTPLPLGPEV